MRYQFQSLFVPLKMSKRKELKNQLLFETSTNKEVNKNEAQVRQVYEKLARGSVKRMPLLCLLVCVCQV